jgi:hypothetical protein
MRRWEMNKYYEALNYLNEIALGDNEFTEDIEVKEEMEKRRDLAYTTLKELLDNHKGGVKFEDIRRVGELRAQHEKVTDNKELNELSINYAKVVTKINEIEKEGGAKR